MAAFIKPIKLPLMPSLHRLISFSLVLSTVLSVRAFAAGRFPIHAWASVPADQTTAQRYRELADCGFTSSFSGFPDPKSAAAALDVAQSAGVKLFISLPQLADNPEATARRFMYHPALGGYHLQDEPSAAEFPKLARWTARIEAVDRSHPCYINLFPTYADAQQLGCPTYQEYVDRFISRVPVRFISFDHYPIVGGQVRGDWYQNLEIIRNASINTRKPFWAFCLSVAHGPYPVPTIAHLRLQAFSDLAYGAQCIQYFTYWTPSDSPWNFRDGPIDARGNRTATYSLVKQMNAEIQALAPVFLGCRVLSVAHTDPQPAGTTAYRPAEPVKSLQTDGSGALVSLLANSGHRYLAVVNRDIAKPMTLRIAFAPAASVRSVDKTGISKPLPDASYSGQLDPGDICLFAWNRGKPLALDSDCGRNSQLATRNCAH